MIEIYSPGVPGPPDAPTISDVLSESCTATWSPPENDGGSEVVGYHLERRLTTGAMRWIQVNKERIQNTTLNVSDLVEGNEYEFRVAAENQAGIGQFSPPSQPFTAKNPFEKPGKPGRPIVKQSSDVSMSVEWTAPDSDGGSEILNYIIEYRADGSSKWEKYSSKEAITITNQTVEGLKANILYEFRVSAENKAGVGPVSDVSILEPPGSPTSLKAEDITKQSASIQWQPPESDGGSPVTGYFVERKSNGKWTKVNIKPVSECQLEMEDLKEKTKYFIRVTAVNLAGAGKPCEEISFVAKNEFDVPGKPGQPEISDMVDSTLLLSWKAPSVDGGTPIINYIVEMKKKGDIKWQICNTEEKVTETEYRVKNLLQDVDIEFRVTAENKAGKGEPSVPSSPVKYGMWGFLCAESNFAGL